MWDQRYSAEEYIYGREPNAFYSQELDKLKPGKILLPAEGEGRNAVYAAEKGWEALGFDQSEEGRRKGLLLAASRNVTITYQIQDLETINCPDNHFDALALIFVHTPETKRQAIHRNLIRFLKPGGTLILEGFSKEQLKYESGGPKEISLLFSLEDIRSDFQSMKIDFLEKMVVNLDDGGGHQGKGSVIRLVARAL